MNKILLVMAPIKFEEKIKEKLEERVIEPSNNSWERLSQQLDTKQLPVKDNLLKSKDWYRIAAIFVGVLFVTSIILYQNSNIDNIEPKLVDNSNSSNQENKTTKEVLEIKEDSQEQYKVSQGANLVNAKKENKSLLHKTDKILEKPKSKRKDLKSDYNKEDETMVAHKDMEKPTVIKQKEELALAYQDSLLDQNILQEKIEDVIAKVTEFEKNNVAVSEEEIDQLLLQAQREITAKKMIESGTISASTLLQEVEQELDDTFKQRVFDALKSGFQKVKTTVAQRKN